MHSLPPPCALYDLGTCSDWNQMGLLWLEASQKFFHLMQPPLPPPRRGGGCSLGKSGPGGFSVLGLGQRVLSFFPTLPTSGLGTFLFSQEGWKRDAGQLRTNLSLRLGWAAPSHLTASSGSSNPSPTSAVKLSCRLPSKAD